MKNMTVRGIDSNLTQKLKETAKLEGKSVNLVVVELLRKQLGLKKEKKFTRTYDDLDQLFGRWSQEEFDLIQGTIDAERTIDEELWT
ncbi:MAG: antitoxin [Deltaproteobacteria bacterium]|nr:antitoxin [Deltaproteobacteria bacterium]